jgi:hypothetical protein
MLTSEMDVRALQLGAPWRRNDREPNFVREAFGRQPWCDGRRSGVGGAAKTRRRGYKAAHRHAIRSSGCRQTVDCAALRTRVVYFERRGAGGAEPWWCKFGACVIWGTPPASEKGATKGARHARSLARTPHHRLFLRITQPHCAPFRLFLTLQRSSSGDAKREIPTAVQHRDYGRDVLCQYPRKRHLY